MDGLSLALERLVRRSEGAVRGIGLRHGLVEAEIDELFQDVRIRLWKVQDGKTEKLEEISPAYVYRTATSAALALLKTDDAERIVDRERQCDRTPLAVLVEHQLRLG